MIEVRFRTAADRALWCDSARASAAFGVRIARSVSLCLQQLAALDSLEEIVLLPRASSRRGERWVLDLNGDAKIVLSAAGQDVVAGSKRTVDIIAIERIEVDGTP